MLSRSVMVLLLALITVPITSLADDDEPLVTDPVYARASRLVEIEPGRSLNIYCVGTGNPTVIFESGLGGGTPSWAPIQAIIATHNRTCSYDRAGINFSDPSNRAGSSANIVDDLHHLLVAASIEPPYVMVGHSYGGMTVRLFADKYPNEVAGMVLVDPTHEDQSEGFRALNSKKMSREDWEKQREPRFAFYRECAAAASAGFIPESEIYKECVESDSLFGDAINEAYLKLQLRPGYWRALLSENESVFGASSDQVRASRKSYGELPLIVLTRSPAPKRDTETQEHRDASNRVWNDLHDNIAALSTIGVNRIVPDSGHAIQFDQPQAVIKAILELLPARKEDAPAGGA